MSSIEVNEGIFYIDGKPRVAISADYPYYRDKRENWNSRIKKIKEAGIDTITFYIPWRHHYIEEEDKFDFSGKTKPNRDVISFIKLIAENKMYCYVKPGPLCHAELDFGGLPDYVEGGKLGEPMLNSLGKKRRWFGRKVLPAPFDKKYEKAVRNWFREVKELVIKPQIYPSGPIIAIQVLNEGLYSDGQVSVLEYDYSISGLRYHYQRLENKYGDIHSYNKRYQTTYRSFEEIPVPRDFELSKLSKLKDLIPYLEWGETQNQYLAYLLQEWGKELEVGLPVFNNINPPLNENKGFDYWLTRVVPETWGINYGFTNWIGVVSHNETAFLRYLLLVKRARGINLEENWGFSKLYDQRYKYHHIPFYQTVLAMGLGATGFNVYTGVSTAHWDDKLDSHHEKPYPATSPVSEEGRTNSKYDVLKILTAFLKDNEDVLLGGRKEEEATWGFYPPYSYLASFGLEDKDYAQLGVKAPRSGFKALDSFMLTMLNEQREFGILNLKEATPDEMQEKKTIVFLGGFFLSKSIQEKLINYVKDGGRLIFFGDVPKLDERMESCNILHELIGDTSRYTRKEKGKGLLIYYPENPFNSGGISPTFGDILKHEFGNTDLDTKKAYVFHYTKEKQDLYYILSYSQFAGEHTVDTKNGILKVNLPAKGCALVSLKDKKIHSCLLKGINDYDKSYVNPSLTLGGEKVEVSHPCDFYYNYQLDKMIMVNEKGGEG